MSRLLQNYDNRITWTFGTKEDGSFHTGIDIVGDTGGRWGALDYIKAHSEGTVIRAEYDEHSGNTIDIEHAPNLITRYCHLGEMYVNVGDEVNNTSIIGYMGNTGSDCNGAHLHFGIFDEYAWINPEPYLESDLTSLTPVRNYYALIDSLYILILNRRADSDGLEAYNAAMCSGRMTYMDVLLELANSREAWLNATDRLYSNLLKRPCESEEVRQNWTGNGINDYINEYNSIVNSDEYLNK